MKSLIEETEEVQSARARGEVWYVSRITPKLFLFSLFCIDVAALVGILLLAWKVL